MEITVEIENNLRQLLKNEDTDNDKNITIEDKGPKRFLLEDVKGKTLRAFKILVTQ